MNRPVRLLVVDRDVDIRAVIEDLVCDHGYRVQQAATGEEAIFALQREFFDVALLHLVELRSANRAGFPRGLRLVSMSASERPVAEDRVDAHLSKPFSRAELLEALQRSAH